MKRLSAARIARLNEHTASVLAAHRTPRTPARTRYMLEEGTGHPVSKQGWAIPSDRLLAACSLPSFGFELRENATHIFLYRSDDLVAYFSAFSAFDELVRAIRWEAEQCKARVLRTHGLFRETA
jgi:hypothetical protein